MAVSIPVGNKDIQATIELVEGIGKKSGRPYTAVRVTIGEWTTLVFPNGSMERNYLIRALS